MIFQMILIMIYNFLELLDKKKLFKKYLHFLILKIMLIN